MERKLIGASSLLCYFSYLDSLIDISFDVLFNSPVHLKQKNRYELVSLIKGDISFSGVSGKVNRECHGMSVTFSNSEVTDDSNGTTVVGGQFPALLFQLFR